MHMLVMFQLRLLQLLFQLLSNSSQMEDLSQLIINKEDMIKEDLNNMAALELVHFRLREGQKFKTLQISTDFQRIQSTRV